MFDSVPYIFLYHLCGIRYAADRNNSVGATPLNPDSQKADS